MKTRFLFDPLTNDKIKSLREAKTPAERNSVFMQVFQLSKYPLPQPFIICEYDNNNFNQTQMMSNEKISTFVGLAHYILTVVIDEHNPLTNPIELFNKLMSKNSVPKPPDSIAVFTTAEAKALHKYFKTSIAPYLSLLEFLFRPTKELSVRTTSIANMFPSLMITAMDGATEIDASKEPTLEFCFPKAVAASETKPTTDAQPMETKIETKEDESIKQVKIARETELENSTMEGLILKKELDTLQKGMQNRMKQFEDTIQAKLPAKGKK